MLFVSVQLNQLRSHLHKTSCWPMQERYMVTSKFCVHNLGYRNVQPQLNFSWVLPKNHWHWKKIPYPKFTPLWASFFLISYFWRKIVQRQPGLMFEDNPSQIEIQKWQIHGNNSSHKLNCDAMRATNQTRMRRHKLSRIQRISDTSKEKPSLNEVSSICIWATWCDKVIFFKRFYHDHITSSLRRDPKQNGG